MCLAVPGKVLSINPAGDDVFSGPVGTVDFQGSRVEVSLQMTPAAKEGDWVLVHAGFALEVLDEKEAREMWEYLEMAEVDTMPDELREIDPHRETGQAEARE